MALVALFIVILWLPLADSILGLDPTPAREERRQVSELPELVSLDFPEDFGAFYRDHFGFRNSLILGHALLRFHLEGGNDMVAVGQDGWLFWRGEHRRASLNEAELEAWRSGLVAQRDWLAQRGCAYVLLVVPPKAVVYADRLPASAGRADRMLGLLAHIKARSDIVVVDPTADLLQARAQGQEVYLRYDQHWNDHGAYIGYSALIAAVRDVLGDERMRALPLEALKLDPREMDNGTLLRMLGIEGTRVERFAYLVARSHYAHAEVRKNQPLAGKVWTAKPHRQPTVTITEHTDRSLPRAVVLHDSFLFPIRPWFSESFSRVYYIHQTTNLYPDIIDRERPRIVIQQLSRRLLDFPASSVLTPVRELQRHDRDRGRSVERVDDTD